ncbi:MAG: 3-hydroxyacyl-ACP dehydratase FabZ [Myxococcales bacterium]|nr:3-hydroxyacyl-ACP dehydratase FabZ [Myxococcales bacterium]MCB9545901.1 3-hydroxyacyl-ACP dehydratase FabZ [Myxococcales bacterium]
MHLPPPEDILPHRPPFLFLDRVLSCGEGEAVAERCFGPEEPFFAGHFPELPVVPGVILVEALAQTLAYLVLRDRPGEIILLTGVDACRIRRAVRPGEIVTFSVRIERVRLGLAQASGRATVGEERVLEAKLSGYLGRPGGAAGR